MPIKLEKPMNIALVFLPRGTYTCSSTITILMLLLMLSINIIVVLLLLTLNKYLLSAFFLSTILLAYVKNVQNLTVF